MQNFFWKTLSLILLPISLISRAVDSMWREHFDVFTGFACILCGGAVYFVVVAKGSNVIDAWALVVAAIAAVIGIIYLQMKRGDYVIMTKMAKNIEDIKKLLGEIKKQSNDK